MGDICPILHASNTVGNLCLEGECKWWVEPAKSCAIVMIHELLRHIQAGNKHEMTAENLR